MPVLMGGGANAYKPIAPIVKPPRQGIGSAIGGVPVGTVSPSASLGGAIGAAPKPSTGTTTTTTITPNQVYESDILNDPGSVAALGTFNAQTNQLAAARADAIQRAIISSGYTPDMSGGTLSGYAGDVTPQTLASAAANPMSQQAQLNLQLQQANQNMPYDLAAGGAGRSGAAAIESGNLQRQYQTSQYQGMQDLLNSIYGTVGNYATNYNMAVNNLDAARAAVAQRLAQTAGYSQSITTDDGSGGTDTSGGIPGYGVPSGQTVYGNYAGSPAYMTSPSTQAAVQRAINAVGSKPPANIYQTIRNMRMG